ncbi:hypothetical protein [Pyrococcus sp. ST04]|uniref:hypothetical protein n=1 Tax=Pyrococcus sp. ST04 TaxID=1183377 RepID=UPI0002605EE5|nr:hypothetical protein [Pyrococcus sp. ST04]AFK23241.1 hypothetical protein Py04_1671 [Pyrococcus sp. ST04]
MKAKEVLKLLDEAEANVKVAIVTFQTRILESPHTSWEFTQRSLELMDILDELKELRKKLEKMDPEAEVDDEIAKMLKKLVEFRAHAL